MWASPGFMKFTSNYVDILMNPEANAEWCAFIAGKIRAAVDDPETAERLIPKDHRYGEKRPPYVTGYFEAFNRPNVELVDLRDTPMLRVTETGIETTDGERRARRDRVGHRLRLRHRRHAAHGHRRPGWRGAHRPLGRRPHHLPRRADRRASPTSSSPAAPTRRPATTPATTATRSTSSPTCWSTPGRRLRGGRGHRRGRGALDRR